MITDIENQVAAMEEEKDAALDKVDEKYGTLISQSDKFYNDQIDAAQKYADEQKKIQQEQTDFTIGQIQKQKEQLGKDYAEEQSAAYVDFKKQTDPHGVNAERIAAGGMWGSGYSESAQTAMYNEYQKRVATAKASLDQAVGNLNNAMTQAQAQNSSVLAEIAYKAFTQEVTLIAERFTRQNALLEAKANEIAQVESNYLNALKQMNAENTIQKDVEPSKGSVSTPYYNGDTNADAEKYGTFSNGYQPKGISGHGKLKKSGETVTFDTEVQYGAEAGQTKTVTQNIWVAEDGTKWYWEGRQNCYLPYSEPIESQVIALGKGPISPEELAKLVDSGEVVRKMQSNGSYTLENGNGQKKTTKAGSALRTDGVDLSNVPQSSQSAVFTPTIDPGADPAVAAGQVFGQWIAHILGF